MYRLKRICTVRAHAYVYAPHFMVWQVTVMSTPSGGALTTSTINSEDHRVD